MASCKLGGAAAFLLCAFGAGAVAAQDYLGSHLDTVRESTQLRHQQRMVTPKDGQIKPAGESCLDALTAQERKAAMRRHLKKFKRIEKREGMEAAYCWLKAQVDAGR